MKEYTAFQCVVYLSDGERASQIETCATAREAIERADEWAALGHIATAVLLVVNTETCHVRRYPLS